MGMTVEEYEQKLWAEYNRPGLSVQEKAQFLVDMQAIYMDGRRPGEELEAISRFTFSALMPEKAEGGFDFEAAESLYQSMADYRFDHTIDVAEKLARVQRTQGTDLVARDRAIMSATLVSAQQSVIVNGINNVAEFTPEQEEKFARFERGYREYVAARLKDHPEETWRVGGRQQYDLSQLEIGHEVNYLCQHRMAERAEAYRQSKGISEKDMERILDSPNQVDIPQGRRAQEFTDAAVEQNDGASLMTMRYLEDTDHSAANRIDQLYYKMLDKDKSGPLHRDSKEYKEMFASVEAIHKALKTYDPTVMSCRTEMQELTKRAHAAAVAYAEKEAYGKKKSTELGITRKNSALVLLDLTSSGSEPDWSRVTDLRFDGGKKVYRSGIHLVWGERQAHEETYGQTARTDRMQARAEYKASGSRMREMNNALTVTGSMEARRSYFGIDPAALTETSGYDPQKLSQIPEDQKRANERVDAIIQGISDDSEEMRRGYMGGLTNMAVMTFMHDNPGVTLEQALDPNQFQEQKRAAGEKVLSALEAANGLAGKERNVKPLAQIVSNGMEVLGSIDLKKGALEYLGKPADLSPEETMAVFQDPANREKLVSYISAYQNFAVQAYQALNRPGLKGQGKAFEYGKLAYGKTGDEAVNPLAEIDPPRRGNVKPFLKALMEVTPEAVRNDAVEARHQATSLTDAKTLFEYMSNGKKRGLITEPTKAAQVAMGFDRMLHEIAVNGKLTNPRFFPINREMQRIDPSQIGISHEEMTVEHLMFHPLTDKQSTALETRINESEIVKGAKPLHQMSAAQAMRQVGAPLPRQPQSPPPITQGPPPTMQPSVSASVPLPQSKPVQPTVTQVSPPPTSQPTVPRQDEPQTKSQPKTRRRSQSDPGPRPKRETEQSTPQRRERSWSIHSKKHAEKVGKLPQGMGPK